MLEIIKKNHKKILFSIIYGILAYSLYFQAHYVHDSYRIYNFGFFQNLSGFWTQGRPICMWFNMLFNFLKISPRIGQIISVFLVIVFMALSTNIVYNLIIKRISSDSKLNTAIFILTNCLFFNVYITEWMVFFEGCVFAFGCFLSILGAYYIIELKQTPKKIFISSILFIISIFCYQAVVAMAGTLIIAFTIYDNKDKNILQIIKKILINMIPYIIALVANFIFIKIININNSSDIRLSGNVNILYNIFFVIKQIKWCIIDMFNYPTKYIIALAITIISIFYIIKVFKNKDENKITVLYTLVTLFSLWFLSILPIMAMPSNSIYFIPRSVPYLASFLPLLLIVIYLFNNKLIIKYEKYIYITSIIFILFSTLCIIRITSECLKNNVQDIHIAKNIQNEIDNYESSTGKTIDKIILLPDKILSTSEGNITQYSDNSVRAFSADYATKEIMYFANKRLYDVTEGTLDEKEKIFGQKEYDCFDYEQLKFDENILYMVKY